MLPAHHCRSASRTCNKFLLIKDILNPAGGVVAVLSLTLTSDLLWLDNKLLVGCKKGEMAELTGERDPDPRKAAHANHSIFIDLCLHPEVEPGRSRRQGGAFMLLVYSS